MDRGVLKGYLRQNLLGIIISVVIFLALYFVVKDKLLVIFFAGIGLFDFIKGFFTYKKKQEYLAELAERGLIEQDANDSSFIIKWEKIRKRGMLKYCLVDGGILMGFWLALFIGFITFLIQLSFFGTPIGDTQSIELCCSIGIFLGIGLSFFMWSVNEEKFKRLKASLY